MNQANLINGETKAVPNVINESKIIPYSISGPIGSRVLVLAPHPDDETLGCGGSIKILTNAGIGIKVLFLTGGERADPAIRDLQKYSAMREKEAEKAMKVLGVADYSFLRFPDRELYLNINKVREIISDIIEDFRPDTLYSPSMIDLHPDHRAAAVLALDVTKAYGMKTVFYEITTPIRPNTLVDISNVFKTKKRAIRVYRSQLMITDYQRLISALNTYRTFTLTDRVKYAEAFWVLDGKTENDVMSWLNYQSIYKGD